MGRGGVLLDEFVTGRGHPGDTIAVRVEFGGDEGIRQA